MLCLAFAYGKLFGSLWNAKDQGSPAHIPSEETTDLMDIETVPSPLRRLLNEEPEDDSEGEDDESSKDEKSDEDDEEDDEKSDEDNAEMKRLVDVTGGIVVGGLAAGLAVYCRSGSSKPLQGIAVIKFGNLDEAAVTALNGDDKVLSQVGDSTTIIHTLYATIDEFKAKHTALGSATADHRTLRFTLKGFSDTEKTTVQGKGLRSELKNDVLKNDVLMTGEGLATLLGTDITIVDAVAAGKTQVTISDIPVLVDMENMIMTKAPPPPAAQAPSAWTLRLRRREYLTNTSAILKHWTHEPTGWSDDNFKAPNLGFINKIRISV